MLLFRYGYIINTYTDRFKQITLSAMEIFIRSGIDCKACCKTKNSCF